MQRRKKIKRFYELNGEDYGKRTYARSDIPCREVGGRNERRFAGRTGLA